jgi:hypothetical protein
MSSNMEKFSIRTPVEQNGGFFGLFETDKTLTKLICSSLDEGKIDIACYLLKKLINNSELGKVDFKCTTKDNRKLNILHLLAMNSKNPQVIDIIRQILSSDVNIEKALNAQDKDGNTPVLRLFKETQDSNLIELAKNKGADTTIQNEAGINIMTDKDTTEMHKSESDNDYSIFNKKTDSDKSMTTESNTASDTLLFTNVGNTENLTNLVGNISKPNKLSESSISNTTQNINALDTIANNMEKHSVGGSYDSQEIIDMLMNTQTGGKKRKSTKKMSRSGTRHVNTYSEFTSSDNSAVNRLSRSVDNKSEQLHQSAMEKIKSILKDVEPKLKGEELSLKARAYKAIIYAQVKDKNPSMSNYERAVELEKQVTESNIKNIKKNESSRLEDIASHISEKDKMRSEKMSPDSDKTAMNSESSTDKKKKPSKKSKDTTEMSGGFQSDYEYLEVDTDKVYSVVDFSD